MKYVLSVMSSDHPGIVAGVSDAVVELGGNIISCSQTVLGGYFTFITIIDLPKEQHPDELAKLVRNSKGLGVGYHVMACEFEEKNAVPKGNIRSVRQTEENRETFVITAFGKDRPGIVKQFSMFLAGHDVNITDLYGYQADDDFMLIGQLTIPLVVHIGNLQDDLEEAGKEYGFTVRLQHNNIFVATNQLRWPPQAF